MKKSMIKKALGLGDLSGLAPVVGPVAQGIISPEEGASRGSTALMGGLGSGLGAILGGTGAGALSTTFDETGNVKTINPAIILAGLLGGSAGGNLLGRWLARSKKSKEEPTLEDLKAAIEEMKGGKAPIMIATQTQAASPEQNNEILAELESLKALLEHKKARRQRR